MVKIFGEHFAIAGSEGNLIHLHLCPAPQTVRDSFPSYGFLQSSSRIWEGLRVPTYQFLIPRVKISRVEKIGVIMHTLGPVLWDKNRPIESMSCYPSSSYPERP